MLDAFAVVETCDLEHMTGISFRGVSGSVAQDRMPLPAWYYIMHRQKP